MCRGRLKITKRAQADERHDFRNRPNRICDQLRIGHTDDLAQMRQVLPHDLMRHDPMVDERKGLVRLHFLVASETASGWRGGPAGAVMLCLMGNGRECETTRPTILPIDVLVRYPDPEHSYCPGSFHTG